MGKFMGARVLMTLLAVLTSVGAWAQTEEGEGWSFNSETHTLTISDNVTGEPWISFAGDIYNVIAEKNVTQMSANAFTDGAYSTLNKVFLRSTTVVELNDAFNKKYESYDSEQHANVWKDRLGYDIYVPFSLVESYQNTYATWLEYSSFDFYSKDIAITLPASGVMTYSPNGYMLDFTNAEGLKAYVATDFNPATGTLAMQRVMISNYADAGMVLKGKPNTTYYVERTLNRQYVPNLLEKGEENVDPTEDTDYTYLYLDLEDSKFKTFTESKDLTGQAYLLLDKDEYGSVTTPVTMLFSDEDALTFGVVNDDCHWSYDADTKTLTLSGDYTGTGDFSKEYDPEAETQPAPWRTYTMEEGLVHKGVDDGIEHIVVENGVYSIGSYAFYGLKNLVSVSLAPTVYSLSAGALQECPKLETVVCSYWEGVGINIEDGTYSVANVGETYYVPNRQKAYIENILDGFDVKVEGFALSDGELKVDFNEDPLTWVNDQVGGHYTGEISMIGYHGCWIEDAKATVDGIDYTYEDDLYVDVETYYYRKDNQDPDLEEAEVTEEGKYYVKATVDGCFADETKNTAISEHYADLYVAASSGEGWSYDRNHCVLTISGNVTGEPWKVFKHDMEYVVVEEGVTQLPEKAFYGYFDLSYAIIKGANVNLNNSFLCMSWDENEYLCTNIYVPASSVASYSTAYADYLAEDGYGFRSSEISIDITDASEGIRTYSDEIDLDISVCEGLHAYTITNFNPTTGALTLKPVTKLRSWEGFLLMGETGTYTAKVTAGVDKEEDNMLFVEDEYAYPESTDKGVTYINLILAGSGEERGFHPLSEEGELPEHVACLSIKKADFDAWKELGEAKIRLEREDTDATAIHHIEIASTTADNAWYTLSGVRFAGKPAQKGVYIHQGKKFVIR